MSLRFWRWWGRLIFFDWSWRRLTMNSLFFLFRLFLKCMLVLLTNGLFVGYWWRWWCIEIFLYSWRLWPLCCLLWSGVIRRIAFGRIFLSSFVWSRRWRRRNVCSAVRLFFFLRREYTFFRLRVMTSLFCCFNVSFLIHFFTLHNW